MLKRIIITFLGLFLLSGCADGFRGYFKKSANNKIIDRKGFEGGKRKPLYNKKYISIAKKNIIEENFDDDDDESDDTLNNEKINPSQRNREMYRKMIRRDAARQKSQQFENYGDDYNNKYPSLNTASKKVKKDNSNDKEDKLQKELLQIKSMLNETKKDLEKYHCPIQQNINEKPSLNLSKPQNPEIANKVKTESKVKKKFLSEDDDNINTKDDDKSINTKINTNIIDDHEKESLLPRAI